MASPWDATMLAGIRRQSPKPLLLVQVDLTDPSSKTLKLSNVPFDAPDGSYWEAAIEDMEPIEAPGSFLSTGIDLCDVTLILFNRRLSYQAAGKVAAHAFLDYRWIGATITFWMWETSVASFSNKGQIFKGVVSSYEASQSQIRVACVQRSDWNRVVSPKFVNRKDYPRAPEKSIGLPLPIVIGKGEARPMRGDWANAMGTDRDRFDAAGGAIPTVQGVIVDHGAGASGDELKVVLAGHTIEAFGPGAGGGVNGFLKANTEHPVVYDVTGETFVGTAASGFTVPDDSDDFYYVLIGSDVTAPPSTPASEPRYAMDIGNELSYALLDYDASKRNLRIPLISVDPPGEYVDADVILGYKTVGGATGLQLHFRNTVSASQTNYTIGASTTPTVMVGSSIVGHEPSTPWDFSQCELWVDFNGGVGTGVKCHPYFIALRVKYRPRREGFRVAKRWGLENNKRIKEKMRWGKPVPVRDHWAIENDGEFFANINGQPDTGGGTYTGVAGAQIQRAHDIIYYILDTYLEQSSSQINLSASLHGGFLLLDSPQATHNNKDLVYFLRVDREMTGEEALTNLTRDSLTWLHISRFTDKFQMIAWKPGVGVAYDLTLEPEHLVSDTYLRVRTTPKARVLTGVRLRYLWDVFRKNFIGECRAAHDGSSSGYHYDNLRDQYLSVVTGANDKLQFKRGATTYTATLSAADYDGVTLADHAQTQMRSADAGGFYWVAYGGTIKAGSNDYILLNIAFNAYNVNLNAGVYTMEALATEFARALNAAYGPGGFSVTYSRTTKKFTFSHASSFTLYWALTVGNWARNASALAGMIGDKTGTSMTSDLECEEERFCIISSATLELLWESGSEGLNGNRHDCSELLGYSGLRDLTGVAGYTALSPKNNNEQTLLQSKTRYESRRTLAIDADTIIDTDTARAIVNRLVDLEAEPRIEVEFQTTWMPDLERGRLLSISNRFDSVIPYPKLASDGSWAGKKFWVTSVRQHAVRRWIQEVSCIEAD